MTTKKNVYVCTIGFSEKDEDHRHVASLLNGLGRKKANYIVKAVMAYEQQKNQKYNSVPIDYDKIREFVRQTVEEYSIKGEVSRKVEVEKDRDIFSNDIKDDIFSEKQKTDIEEDAWSGILMSLRSFRK